MKRAILAAMLAAAATTRAQTIDQLWQRFVTPPDSARTKVWWFHGETSTTEQGIDADLEAFKEKGVGGVVFYDQVHGSAEGALESMSPEWWRMMKYAARKAKSLGLSFEVAASNGYVTGGPWITPALAMRKTAMADTIITARRRQRVRIAAPHGDFSDIATVIFPDSEAFREIVMAAQRFEVKDNGELTIEYDAGCQTEVAAIRYSTNPRGKGSTGSMNIPGKPQERYFGAGYVDLPPIGEIEYSADGATWHSAAWLPAIENVIGHKSRERTVSFPAVRGRRFRVRLHDWQDAEGRYNNLFIENIRLATRDMTDNIEVKSGLRTEVTYPRAEGGSRGAIAPQSIRTAEVRLDEQNCAELTVDSGTWHIIRFGHVPTGARTKHGRRNLLGLEADVMSAEAATVHYNRYFKAICDTLAAIGCKPDGMCMDSHEAGIQNWTPGFEERFRELRGYDLSSVMPALAGYIVGERGYTERILSDFRRTIAETIGTQYYGTLASLCRRDGVDFTSQAMLNIDADNIFNRSFASKPQGEFWAYQTDGNYDCLDAASAAHLYGRPTASAEAFTDTPYDKTWDELLRIANLAYCRGINEFAVCASSYQPWSDRKYDDSASAHPYVFHRLHPRWESSGPFWEYQARCAQLLREGEPVVDLCIYIGEDVPLKTFAYKLPEIPEGYNFDVCTFDALVNRLSAHDGLLAAEGGMRYRALVVQGRTHMSAEALRKIEELERSGATVIRCDLGQSVAERVVQAGIAPDMAFTSAAEPDDRLCFFHRSTGTADIYFVYNHSGRAFDSPITLRTPCRNVEAWNPLTAERTPAEAAAGTLQLKLEPYQSMFLIARKM